MRIDLHIHTNYSDGEINILNTTQSLFSDYGLVSLTDHEHIFDPSEFHIHSSAKFISGVEICCNHGDQNIEILGYDFDAKNVALIALVDKVKELRLKTIKEILDRNEIFIEKLPSNPFRINVPLPNDKDSHKFWQRNNLEYKTLCHSVPAVDVIEAIVVAHGIPVLAHPMESLVGKNETDIEIFILSLGIRTVELITPKHRKDDVALIESIIDRNNLFGSIGSDSHKAILTEIPYKYDISERRFDWIHKLI